MLYNIDKSEIRFWAKRANSVNQLGRLLGCSGSEKCNMNGRDLRAIRQALGLKEYAKLSGNKSHGGRSFYAQLYEVSKKDVEIRQIANEQIKKHGMVADITIDNAVDSYNELSKR